MFFDIFEIRQIQKPHIYPFISTGIVDEKMAFLNNQHQLLTHQILYDYVAGVRICYAPPPPYLGLHDGRCFVIHDD